LQVRPVGDRPHGAAASAAARMQRQSRSDAEAEQIHAACPDADAEHCSGQVFPPPCFVF